MGIVDIFAKRQRRMRGEFQDVYQCDDLPATFRTQVVFILSDLFACKVPGWKQECFQALHDILARELGVFRLHAQENNPWDEVMQFFLTTTNVEVALSVIELSFRVAGPAHQQLSPHHCKMLPSEAVNELNKRFMEHGIGYQFESDEIVRIDSKFLHQEAVKPALQILKATHYASANGEFRKAHEHYRHQRYSEAVTECLKTLESTLKVICHRREWGFNAEKDTVSQLIDIVFDKGLLPGYLQSQFGTMRSLLKSGVPTIRNRESSHGAGEKPSHIPQHLAAYALHLTASAIVFISRCDDAFSTNRQA